MADIGTLISTWLTGRLVGRDDFGNAYYQARGTAKPAGSGSLVRARRWVIFKGRPEASKVPAEWHAWLHHTVQTPPSEAQPHRWPWQRQHIPNLTGTELAYRPPGHPSMGAQRTASGSDYEAWSPDNS